MSAQIAVADPQASQRIAQTIDNLRVTEEEFRMKSEECNQQRAKINELTAELERYTQLYRRSENTLASRTDELSKTKHSLDIVLKELNSKKSLVDNLQQENARLKRDLDSTQRHSGEVVKTLHSKSVAQTVGSMKESPANLYVEACFRSRCNAHPDIVRGLHDGESIETSSGPVNFQQLNALLEVLELQRTRIPPPLTGGANAAGQSSDAEVPTGVLRHISIAVESQECFVHVAHLIRSTPYLVSVELVGLGDLATQDIASALAIAESVVSLSLPKLCVSDTGLQTILSVVNKRETLSMAEDPKQSYRPLRLLELDLTDSHIVDPLSFDMIRGSSFVRLNLSGCAELKDRHLGDVCRNCTKLEELTLVGCSDLTNDAIMFVNTSRSVKTLNIHGCKGISRLSLFFVETLFTDLAGVSHVDCPALRVLPDPIVHFRLVHFSAPCLEEVTFKNMSLSLRELQLISDSSAKSLLRVQFVSCRFTEPISNFFRQIRKAEHLSLHSCKGITDADILCLSPRLLSLDLTDNYCLTDKSIKYIAETCRSATHLTIKRCANITDHGLANFVNHAALSFLNVLGTRKVTVVGLHRLIQAVPTLQHLVHESLVSPSVQVDREDVEEEERSYVSQEQRLLLSKRDVAALSYVTGNASVLSTQSPVRSERLGTANGARYSPRPPSMNGAGAARSPNHPQPSSRPGTSSRNPGQEGIEEINAELAQKEAAHDTPQAMVAL